MQIYLIPSGNLPYQNLMVQIGPIVLGEDIQRIS